MVAFYRWMVDGRNKAYLSTMPRSTDETRREFLTLLAKAAVFLPPALATVSVDRLAASVLQGNGAKSTDGSTGNGNGGNGNGNGNGNVTIGSLSTSGQTVQNTSFRTQGQTSDRRAPWNPGTSAAAPWQKPPPSSSGGED